MAGTPELSAFGPDERQQQQASLSLHDGSIFSTSTEVNPQLSIHKLGNRPATQLARELSGHSVRLA